MKNNKEAKYLDIVDIVDRTLPSKQDFNYVNIHPVRLTERFNTIVNQTVFAFEQTTLEDLQMYIGKRQETIYQNDKGKNSSNYTVQNNVSHMKKTIINNLASDIPLLSINDDPISNKLGTYEELKNKIASEKVEKYISNVLTCDFNNILKVDPIVLAEDMMLHACISIKDRYPENFLKSEIANIIREFVKESKQMQEKDTVDSLINQKDVFNKTVEIISNKIMTFVEKALEQKKAKLPATDKDEQVVNFNRNEELSNLQAKYETLQRLMAKKEALLTQLAVTKENVDILQKEIDALSNAVETGIKR